jgi:WD40 repeat protein
VRLVVDKVNTCHTRPDVERALEELPAGMEALYDRMARSLAQSLSVTDRAFASTILQCVTCSLRVLTVTELSQALDQNTSEMLESLDFQRSIIDLCQGFVVIDNGGNVDMVHQTAREYLHSSGDHPFHLDRYVAHQQIFLSCMRCLMAPGLRAKLGRSQKPEFLQYAATLWSSHLILTPIDCEQVFQVMKKFFTGHWVLTWIYALATSNQLRVLVQASKNLSKYTAKRKVYDSARNERPIVEQELLESWAVDLLKIVGKFGTNLRRNPESIYKIVPPFCPQNSSIYQLFGKMEAKSLMVSGLSTENWDDSLARMSLGYGTRSSSIMAAGSQVAVLATPGSIFMYDSSTFEETAVSPFTHGERVYRMEFNSTATMLATYGYRTVKFWETATGKCKISVETLQSRPRPLAMLFAKNNTELFVGFEDRKIRSLDLNQSTSPTWQLVAELEEEELEGHNLNSSSYMALNRDGSLIAVAYRGHPLSAWEIDGQLHIGHCWRKREEICRGEVIEAVWHPHAPELLGLYIEGVVFKWRPYENEVDEIATGASRLAISRDGILFATGDVRGTVKVFTTSGFSPIYQLTSQENVLGLIFSPDLRRFYDIRGYYANAWEPNALMKFAEHTGKDNESEADSIAQSSTAYTSQYQSIDAITALACSPTGRLYCCGTEKGTVRLHNAQGSKIADLFISEGVVSIEQIAWSMDGRYISFSDSDEQVVIMSISSGAGITAPIVKTAAKIEVEIKQGGILQLLFHPDSSQLLVHSASTTHVISLTTYSITHSLEAPKSPRKWINHPQDQALIIGFGPLAIHILDWALVKSCVYAFELPLHLSLPSNPTRSLDQAKVDRVFLTSDRKHTLVQISSLKQGSQEKTLLMFKISSFSTSTTPPPEDEQKRGPNIITPTILPSTISAQIALAFSFLSHDRLVFLSKTFSICTWQVTPDAEPLSFSVPSARSEGVATKSNTAVSSAVAGKMPKELFSLPGDWISRDCLVLCSVWGVEKSFLCPRNGEIAVVKCAALA